MKTGLCECMSKNLYNIHFFTPQKCIHVPLNRNSNTPAPFFFFRMQVPLTMTCDKDNNR